MKKLTLAGVAIALVPAAITGAHSQSSTGSPVPVSADNFVRAESDLYFSGVVKNGGFGRFDHTRSPAPIDKQTVIRLNRDTLYSAAVFDLDAGPVTITLPNAGKRFMSLQVIDEDQYTHGVYYGAGRHVLSRKEIGTRYVVAAVRTLADPTNPEDVKQVHALQDAIKVELAAPELLSDDDLFFCVDAYPAFGAPAPGGLFDPRLGNPSLNFDIVEFNQRAPQGAASSAHPRFQPWANRRECRARTRP